jgi:hypothetical protein
MDMLQVQELANLRLRRKLLQCTLHDCWAAIAPTANTYKKLWVPPVHMKKGLQLSSLRLRALKFLAVKRLRGLWPPMIFRF